MRILFERLGHPLILLFAFGLWTQLGRNELALLAALSGALALLHLLEALQPERPDWVLSAAGRWRLLGALLLMLVLSSLVNELYSALMRPLLPALVDGAALPLLLQIAVLFFGADLVYYGVHRGIHRWAWLWRASGHGVHHSFHKLQAAHFALTHPFELLLLALPMLLVAALLGASSQAVAGATLMLVVNAALAHSNLRFATPGLQALLTHNHQHRLHHSQDFDDSNRNFACNAIVWDRLFGTYREGAVAATGIGPRQPGLAEMLKLPFVEPGDVDTVASRQQGRR